MDLNTPFVIVEVASNHAGDLKRFPQYINLCASNKSASIKFQIFDVDSLCHSSYRFISDLSTIALTYTQWTSIINSALAQGLDVWLEPFDSASLIFCQKFAPKVSLKVPSCDLFHFHNYDLSGFKVIGLSVGGLSLLRCLVTLTFTGKNLHLISLSFMVFNLFLLY